MPLIISVCFAAFLVNLEACIVNISLPSIAAKLQVTMSDVSLVVLVYVVFLAASSLILGRMIDIVGTKRVFLSGYVGFIITSFFCGISPNLPLLLISRSLQGIGGAMLAIAGFAAIARSIAPEKRGSAFGFLGTASSLGAILGSPLGGLINGYLSWHWVFLVNIPVGVAAWLVAREHFPDDEKTVSTPGSLDYAGAGMSFVTVFLFVFILNKGNDLGWTSPTNVGSAAAFLLISALFIRHENRHPEPIIDLGIFRNLWFSWTLLLTILAFMAIAGINFILPFFLENFAGFSPQASGFIMLLYAVVLMTVTPLAGKLSDRFEVGRIITIALFIAGVCCGAFSLSFAAQGLKGICAFVICLGIACGGIIAPNSKQVTCAAPVDKQGAVSSLYALVGRLGLILGIAVFEGVFSSYSSIDTKIDPVGFTMVFRLGAMLFLFAGVFSLAGMVLASYRMRQNPRPVNIPISSAMPRPGSGKP